MRRRRGATIIELLAVFALVAILVRIAVPRLWEMRRRATATAVIGDLQAIRLASLNYNQDSNLWPVNYAAGVTPNELVPYLPQSFSFTRPAYDLDFETWTVPSGMPGDPGSTTVIGVALVTNDPKLGPLVESLLGKGMTAYASGGNYTFIVIGMGGMH
ncbi:MAG: type II secretion system protein [Gemmatimonadaceae bacterium]